MKRIPFLFIMAMTLAITGAGPNAEPLGMPGFPNQKTITAPTAAKQGAPAKKQDVYELADKAEMTKLAVNPDVNAYFTKAVDNNGYATDRPDPVLLRWAAENALTIASGSDSTTAENDQTALRDQP